MAAEGIDCEIWPFTSPALFRAIHSPGKLAFKTGATIACVGQRLRHLVKAKDYDCVVVVRELLPFGPPVLEVLLGRMTGRMVVDFDDAIFLGHPEGAVDNRFLYQLKYGRQFDAVLRAAHSAIAGNEYLADYARRYNSRVTVIPTVLDLHRYTLRPLTDGKSGAPLTIGWVGSTSTARHLREISEVIVRLCHVYGDRIRFTVQGDPTFPRLTPQVEVKSFSFETEVKDLHEFDIGLMPLIAEEWSLGKCAAKALQYWSSGIPVVASPVGVATSMVKPGVNGFLANTHEDWIVALTRLIENASLRNSMGASGRAEVEREYSVTAQLPTLISVLHDAATSKRQQLRLA